MSHFHVLRGIGGKTTCAGSQYCAGGQRVNVMELLTFWLWPFFLAIFATEGMCVSSQTFFVAFLRMIDNLRLIFFIIFALPGLCANLLYGGPLGTCLDKVIQAPTDQLAQDGNFETVITGGNKYEALEGHKTKLR